MQPCHMYYSMLYEHSLNPLYGVLQYKDRCMSFLFHTLTFNVSVLLFCPTAVLDAALDILAGKQGSSVFGSVGADV